MFLEKRPDSVTIFFKKCWFLTTHRSYLAGFWYQYTSKSVQILTPKKSRSILFYTDIFKTQCFFSLTLSKSYFEVIKQILSIANDFKAGKISSFQGFYPPNDSQQLNLELPGMPVSSRLHFGTTKNSKTQSSLGFPGSF